MKRTFLSCLALALALIFVGAPLVRAMTVTGTDFTTSFSHSYVTGAVFDYDVGGIFSNGSSQAKQSVSRAEESFVAAQFTSLNGTVSPEVTNFGKSDFGWVYSGRCYGETKYAKKLMFYADVRRHGNIIDTLRVYYD